MRKPRSRLNSDPVERGEDRTRPFMRPDAAYGKNRMGYALFAKANLGD